jgi:hypothetical protein
MNIRDLIRMAPRTEREGASGNQLPAGIVLKPPVNAQDLQADPENDPEGAGLALCTAARLFQEA